MIGLLRAGRSCSVVVWVAGLMTSSLIACTAEKGLGKYAADEAPPSEQDPTGSTAEETDANDGAAKNDGGKSNESDAASSADSGSKSDGGPAPSGKITVVRAPQAGSTLRWTTIWGSASDNVYFGGTGGAVARWDGTAITPVPSFTSSDIKLITGSGPNHVWVDLIGNAYRFDGAAWTNQPGFNTSFAIDATTAMGLDANNGGKPYTGGITRSRFVTNGIPSATTTNTSQLFGHDHAGVWVQSKNDIWVSVHALNGSAYDLEHWNGTSWSHFDLPFFQDFTVYAMSGTSSTDVWLAASPFPSECSAYHWDGLSWTRRCLGLSDDGKAGFTGIYAASPTKVWATGWRGLFYFDGTSWSELTLPTEAGTSSLYAVWGTGANDVWVGGSKGLLLHIE